MARNETHSIRLDHEGCPNKGVARISEPENPVHHPDEGPKVKSLPAGFSQQLAGDGKVELVCGICQQVVATL